MTIDKITSGLIKQPEVSKIYSEQLYLSCDQFERNNFADLFYIHISNDVPLLAEKNSKNKIIIFQGNLKKCWSCGLTKVTVAGLC